jgi:hypothetical protein
MAFQTLFQTSFPAVATLYIFCNTGLYGQARGYLTVRKFMLGVMLWLMKCVGWYSRQQVHRFM